MPGGQWAPAAALAVVIATVALVAYGPRIGGDAPSVPDGRPLATAGTGDRTLPSDAAPTDADDPSSAAAPPVATDDPAAVEPAGAADPPRSAGRVADDRAQPTTERARSRRVAPTRSHRQRRSSRVARERPGASRARPAAPRPRGAGRATRAVAAPASSRSVAPSAVAPPRMRPVAAPHRTSPPLSAEREFGAP